MRQKILTRYLRVDPENPQSGAIAAAAEVIRRGGTVAFPTETVYGLGANGLDPRAVVRIFEAKGRPLKNPLILHVASLEQARALVSDWPEEAEILAERFLPGPLTMILPRSPVVPDQVTAGLPNVALRYPEHPVALALIRASELPIAAPSANLSGSPSPTRAEHVAADLDGRIDLILDGGPTRVGLESTIISLCQESPLLLRPGGVTREQLEEALQRPVLVHEAVLQAALSKEIPDGAPCPGLFFKHYAPRATVIMVTGEPDEQCRKVMTYLEENPGLRVAVLGTDDTLPRYEQGRVVPAYLESLGPRERPQVIAGRFFAALRRCDQAGVAVILVETIPTSGIGLAVMNRLCRAAENRTL